MASHGSLNRITSHDEITIPSFAKINLGLRILNKREDGYHDIETVFQQIDLHDTVGVSLAPARENSEIVLTVDSAEIPADERNLAYRAAKMLLDRIDRPLHVAIKLTKTIPVGAGLGGGSSNAATVLLALNELLHQHFSWEELHDLARKLGADVPFFLIGGLARATGIGDVLEPLSVPLNFYTVVVAPKIFVSTAWAYSSLKIPLTNSQKDINLACFIEKQLQVSAWRKKLTNDFEHVVFDKFQTLGEIKNKLYEIGADYASLSGSGSSLFGLFATEDGARKGVAFFHPQYPTFLCRPVHWGMREIMDGDVSEW